jgi:flagellar biosynthesis protein
VAAALASRSGRARDTRLVAKARGELATELLEIAKAHGIAIHSDADLAEILAALEEDAEIPLEALAAVAEILNYLYESQRTKCGETPESLP